MNKDRKKVTKGLEDQENDMEGMWRFFLKVKKMTKKVFMLSLYTEYVGCYCCRGSQMCLLVLLGLTVTVYYTFPLLCLVGGRRLIVRMPRFLGSQPSSSLWLLFWRNNEKKEKTMSMSSTPVSWVTRRESFWWESCEAGDETRNINGEEDVGKDPKWKWAEVEVWSTVSWVTFLSS